jgi:cytochrome P450
MNAIELDLRDQENILETIRKQNPVLKISENYWLITGYDQVKSFIRNPYLVRQMKESYQENYIHSLLNLDGEEHAKYRKILNPFFSNSSVDQIENNIENNVKKTFKSLKNKSQFDLVSDIAFPIPFYSICEILGVEIIPEEDHSFIANWTNDAMLVLNNYLSKEDYQKHSEGTEKVFTYLVNMLYGTKYKKKETGVFKYLKSYTDGGDSLSNEEIISLCIMLFIGGFETNLNTFTSLAYEFVKDKDMANNVLSSIEEKNTIEELFRHSSSLNFITRRVSRDIKIDGFSLVKNEYVILHIASANRDSLMFKNAHKIIPSRNNSNMHLAFGGGPHYCLGAGLSRFQVKVIVKEFIKNMNSRCYFSSLPTKNKSTSMNGYREMILNDYYIQ